MFWILSRRSAEDIWLTTTLQYNASKAGLVHLAKSLAIEWIDFCRVNCISPGYIATEMLAEAPEEQKNAWLAASPAGRLGETFELKGVRSCEFNAPSFGSPKWVVHISLMEFPLGLRVLRFEGF